MEPSNLGKIAIPGDLPAGSDVRESEQFAILQDEYAKLTNPMADSAPDANIIVAKASDLLANHGKDIMVTAYLTNGMMRQNGLGGLATGFQIMGDLVEAYWESLYPPVARIRGRRNSIEWLIDQTSKYLENTTFEPQQEEVCIALRNNIKRLDELLSAKDNESPPLFRLNQLIDSIPIASKPEPVKSDSNAETNLATNNEQLNVAVSSIEKPAPQSNTTQIASPNPSTPPTPIESLEEAEKELASCNRRFNEIAEMLMEADISNPLAYRLKRIAGWSNIVEAPPSQNLKTMIPPPISQIRDMLSAAQSSGAWANTIQICENNLATSIFWFDLHRISHESLEKIGSSTLSARTEITLAVSQLLQRFPDIAKLTFNDGTPFADESTKNWLTGLENSTHEDPYNESKVEPSDENFESSLETAKKYVADGLWSKSIDTLQRIIDTTPSSETCLSARIEICRLVLSKQPPLNAIPFAEPILKTVSHHHLGEWNPILAAKALRVSYEAYARHSEQTLKASEILADLAKISGTNAYEAIAL